MKFIIKGNWENIKALDGMLFFAQRVEEMLMYYTSHVYKAPVYNSWMLIKEYLITVELVRNGKMNENHADVILEEFLHSLSEDLIIKCRYSQEEIERIKSRLQSSSTIDKEKFMLYLWDKFKDYPKWCKNEIFKAVQQPKEKKKIDAFTRSLIPALIGAGYHPNFIYWECINFFSQEAITIRDFSPIENFLNTFDFKTKKFTVYFAVDKCIGREFQQMLERRIKVSFEQDAYSQKLQYDNDKYICIHIKAKDFDRGGAAEFAYQIFDVFMRYYKFLGNRTNDLYLDRALVVEDNGSFKNVPLKPEGYMKFSHEYDDRTLARSSDRLIAKMIDNSSSEDFFLIDKLIRSHNIAISSEDMSSGFLNFWSIMEIIGVSNRQDAKIQEIINAVMPILKRNYPRIIFTELYEYMKANIPEEDYEYLLSSINETGSEKFKIACMVILDDYEQIGKEAYRILGNYPIIRSRICKLHSEIFNSKKNFIRELNHYEQRLTWHIQRLYRTRNAIIHSREIPENLKSLGEHLHDYVDELILEILESNLSSINNVIIDAQEFMNKLEREYKDKSEKFTVDNIKFILGW